jgi:hypothetical protein
MWPYRWRGRVDADIGASSSAARSECLQRHPGSSLARVRRWSRATPHPGAREHNHRATEALGGPLLDGTGAAPHAHPARGIASAVVGTAKIGCRGWEGWSVSGWVKCAPFWSAGGSPSSPRAEDSAASPASANDPGARSLSAAATCSEGRGVATDGCGSSLDPLTWPARLSAGAHGRGTPCRGAGLSAATVAGGCRTRSRLSTRRTSLTCCPRASSSSITSRLRTSPRS